MAKPAHIELSRDLRIPILHEDRSVLAIDKPAGLLVAPESWQSTGRNLQRALRLSLAAGDFWARSRNLRFIRFVHRLDAETSGVLLLARSAGALRAFSGMFEDRQVDKRYWAVVQGTPQEAEWTCRLKLAPDPVRAGRVKVDARRGKAAETHFRVLASSRGQSLVEARPRTGRTHQVRVHLMAAGHPVAGDALYGSPAGGRVLGLALRAVAVAYVDPFTRQPVRIEAPVDAFAARYGFTAPSDL